MTIDGNCNESNDWLKINKERVYQKEECELKSTSVMYRSLTDIMVSKSSHKTFHHIRSL